MIDIRENVICFLKKNFGKYDIKQTDLAWYLGVPKINVNHWIKGINAPEINYIPGIADFFGVSSLEVIGIENLGEFTIEGIAILKAYRKASPEIKEATRNILKVK